MSTFLRHPLSKGLVLFLFFALSFHFLFYRLPANQDKVEVEVADSAVEALKDKTVEVTDAISYQDPVEAVQEKEM